MADINTSLTNLRAKISAALQKHRDGIAQNAGDISDLQTALGTKLDASGFTAADILAKLLTVDGAASGLDADTLDGKQLATLESERDSAIAAAVSALVDTSPETLDTLSELAAALGNDPDFATTIANQIGQKLDSASYTAADVLAKLLTVDGAGTGLDADKLDGKQLATIESEYQAAASAAEGAAKTHADNVVAPKLDASAYTASDVLTKVKTVDGAGSGLDADLLDGKQAADFATSAQGGKADSAVQPADLASVATSGEYSDLAGRPGNATTTTGGLMASGDKAKLDGIEDGAQANVGDEFSVSGDYAGLRARATTQADVGLDSVDNTSDADKPVSSAQQAALDLKVDIDSVVDGLASLSAASPLSANQGRVLKGLIDNINTLLASDDTTLDELQEVVTYIKANRQTLDALGISNIAGLSDALAGKVDVVAGKGLSSEDYTGTEKTKLAGIEAGATGDQTKADIDALGINADTVDGKHAADFADAAHTHDYLPTTGTATDSSKLGGIAADQYLTVNDAIDLGEL